MLSTIVAFVALTGAFACTFAFCWVLQRIGAFDAPGGQAKQPRSMRRVALPVGPDDDMAFLRELRRRIDLGHFRR